MEWPAPQSREVALFTDLTLYAEALALAQKQGNVTVPSLQRELGQRLQKMRLVLRQSKRTVERLVRELRAFGWLDIQADSKLGLSVAPHIITDSGKEALSLSQRTPREFRRLLTIKMQQVYVIPGWFIARLWQINPRGQGEVILPAPPPDWQPTTRTPADAVWNTELKLQSLKAAKLAKQASPDAFPIEDNDWLASVQQAWNRLGAVQPNQKDKEESRSFRPRTRLALAMREASVGLLFNRIPYGASIPDFPGSRPPIYPRTFMGWCPRLESLELVFYSDWHPQVNGRILFPLSAFRSVAPLDRFEELQEVRHPNMNPLWLYQPNWHSIRSLYLQTLIAVHQNIASRKGTLYVSLLDVRDEVCRRLRVSSLCFETFLQHAINELPTDDFPWSVAVETDIREGQSSGAGQLRQPVYLNNVPNTLIGLARLP